MISPEIFRAYDIRGIVGETLTPETVYIIAKSIGKLALAQNQETVLIARDGRLSGPLLSCALRNGLLDGGCSVIDIGAAPTPLLYFATHTLSTQSGIMLTGSHNPGNYNGLKTVIAGKTLSGDAIQLLYQDIVENSQNIFLPDYLTEETVQAKYHDKYLKYNTILNDYVHTVTNNISLAKKLKIVMDCGNGITGNSAPMLFRALGCEVIELFSDVDGHFPHHHPDPSEPENLQDLIEAVKVHQADVGLAFDGDGDRLGVVTNQGEIIYPDRQLMLFAKAVLRTHPGEKIIYDVKCTKHLTKVISENHGQPEMNKTGHSLIKKRLLETLAPLAGEMSGHIFFRDRWYGFDDALYAGARLCEILSNESQTCSEIFRAFPNSVNTPELKLSVTQQQREKILSSLQHCSAFQEARLITIDGLRVEFEKGWGLVRGSNTTPHLTLRFEGEDEETLKAIQTMFKEALLNIDKTLILNF